MADSRKCDELFAITCRGMDDHLFEFLQNILSHPIFMRKQFAMSP
jgi:hypothetical protein